jgi:hypothetical protein
MAGMMAMACWQQTFSAHVLPIGQLQGTLQGCLHALGHFELIVQQPCPAPSDSSSRALSANLSAGLECS